MQKITFIWSNVTHSGIIVLISPLGSFQLIEIEEVEVDNKPAEYLTFSILVSEVKIGQHGPIRIISIVDFIKPVKLL